MTNKSANETAVRIEDANTGYKYWFGSDGNLTVFIPGTILGKSGFKAEQLAGAEIILAYKPGKKGPVATKILSINGERVKAKTKKPRPTFKPGDTGIGRIAAFDKGFGFIKVKGGYRDLFFHINDVDEQVSKHAIAVDVTAEFEVIDSDRGPRAVVTGVRFDEKVEGFLCRQVGKVNVEDGFVSICQIDRIGLGTVQFELRRNGTDGEFINRADRRSVANNMAEAMNPAIDQAA